MTAPTGSLPPIGLIRERVWALQEELSSSSGGRTRLLPMTKGFGPDAVRAVQDAGVSEIGENYAQELLFKYREIDDVTVIWHMVGQLQRNKVRRLGGVVSLWQSVDRIELVNELARWVPGGRILVQVDVLDRPWQGGCRPGELEALVVHAHERGLTVAGLMTVGVEGDLEATEQSFATTARLADQLNLPERSMGMTNDRHLAVEYGSTVVRIGRALFGER